MIKIGDGTYGDVYKTNSNTPVAIKRYRGTMKNELTHQTLREIHMLKLVNHENLIKLLNVVADGYRIEAHMECGLMDLSEYAASISKSVRVANIDDVARQILHGCEYLHANHIIHRDIKPKNVIVMTISPTITIKLCDFGLSKKMIPFKCDRDTRRVYSQWYRAPELFGDTLKYGFAIDMWAIGCSLYEYVTLNMLFDGKTEADVLASILRKVPVTVDVLNTLGIDISTTSGISISKCNTSKYYKIPSFYELTCFDKLVIDKLDRLKKLVEKMLVIDPSGRVGMTDALNDCFFADLPVKVNRTGVVNTPTPIIRSKTPDRRYCVKLIIERANKLSVNKQTVMIATDIADRFLAIPNTANGARIESIAICCLAIGSKLCDFAQIQLADYVSELGQSIMMLEREVLQTIKFDMHGATVLDLIGEKMLPEEDWQKIINNLVC